MGERLDRVVATLRARREALKGMGVHHAAVFGSLARDEAGARDADILVDVDPAVVRTLFDLGGLQQTLEAWLAMPVDVARRDALRPETAELVERERVDAF